jgi:hypothetical protein
MKSSGVIVCFVSTCKLQPNYPMLMHRQTPLRRDAGYGLAFVCLRLLKHGMTVSLPDRSVHDTDAIMDIQQDSTLTIAATMLCSAVLALQSYAFVPGLPPYGMILQPLPLPGGRMCETDTTLHQFPGLSLLGRCWTKTPAENLLLINSVCQDFTAL